MLIVTTVKTADSVFAYDFSHICFLETQKGFCFCFFSIFTDPGMQINPWGSFIFADFLLVIRPEG